MRAVLVLSVCLNVALAGWMMSSRPVKLLPQLNLALTTREPVQPANIPVAPAMLRWSSLESTDFKQYIANLKAAGCPEETIRDLILAEVNKLYAPKFMALAANTAGASYWKDRSTRVTPEFRSAFTALSDEKKHCC